MASILHESTDKRKVMIATPTYNGTIDVWYAMSLVQSIKIGYRNNIPVEIIPIWLSYDALIQRARNDCIALALESNCDDLIFIDADIEWDPQWIYQLLMYPVDVVGGVYKRKSDTETVFVVKSLTNDDSNWVEDKETGLIEVMAVGTGFLKLSRKALQYLWDSSEEYVEYTPYTKVRRMIFNLQIYNGALMGEDIGLCYKLREGGFKIYVDPKMTCTHMGLKKYPASFIDWIENLKKTNQPNSTQTEKKDNDSNGVKSLYE